MKDVQIKHILVTGGAGFIGSHLCEDLLERGYAVTVIDSLLTGRKENLTPIFNEPLYSNRFQWIQQDICDPLPEDEMQLLQKHGLSGIFHMACPASPVDFDKIPFEILKVDSIGTMRTVELALKYQSRYLLASTSEVYGDPLIHPQPESYWGNVNPRGPRACYDEAKRFSEAYVSTATTFKKLNSATVRIFNTYGPRMRLDDGRIVPELCRQALLNQPLTVHGDGLQTRSFCYVSDLVRGIIQLFESSIQEPVNLGNPVEYRVLDFAEMVIKLTQSSTSITHLPGRLDDPKKRCPDITRAQTLLGWSPKIQLEEGLQACLNYFKMQLPQKS